MDEPTPQTLLDDQDVSDVFFGLLGRRPREEILASMRAQPNLNAARNMLLNSPEFRSKLTGVGRALDYTTYHGRVILHPLVRREHYLLKNIMPFPLTQIVVSHASKTLYCPIGKVACTFLKQSILRMSALPHQEALAGGIHDAIDTLVTGLQLTDYSPEDVQALLRNPDYLSFVVVRNPFDRLLSAYIEKFVLYRLSPGNQYHAESVISRVYEERQSAPADFDRGITFKEFIFEITQADMAELDPHWRPQHMYMAGNEYQSIYALEQLNKVVKMLSKRSGMKLSKTPQNVTGSGVGNTVPNAELLYPREIMDIGNISRESFYSDEIKERLVPFVEKDDIIYRTALAQN